MASAGASRLPCQGVLHLREGVRRTGGSSTAVGRCVPSPPTPCGPSMRSVAGGEAGSGRQANVRAWLEAIAAVVAALAAVLAIVITQKSSEPELIGAGGQPSDSADPGTPVPGSDQVTAADAVRSFFITDNGAGCVDILARNDLEPGRVALLGCTVAGGDVKVDLAKFDSTASLSTYFARIQMAVGDEGELQDWSLGGEGQPRTGSTLEFIARGGKATILWTYDAHGMAAMASRDDGDQVALNRWWATFGALVEDEVVSEVKAGR